MIKMIKNILLIILAVGLFLLGPFGAGIIVTLNDFSYQVDSHAIGAGIYFLDVVLGPGWWIGCWIGIFYIVNKLLKFDR
jgi:hypothetical protein